MIKIAEVVVPTVRKQFYRLIRPNITLLAQKTYVGKLTRNELLHLVVHLADKPRAFTPEVKMVIKYEILTQVSEEYDGKMQAIARHGLKLIDEQTHSLPPTEKKPDPAFDYPSPLLPPTGEPELSGTVVDLDEDTLPHSYRVYDLGKK